MPRLLNLKTDDCTGAVLIDRRTKWGNRFEIGKHGNRDQCCELFELDVGEKPDLIAAAKRELRGRDLACHCAPLRCHGDFWIRVANE